MRIPFLFPTPSKHRHEQTAIDLLRDFVTAYEHAGSHWTDDQWAEADDVWEDAAAFLHHLDHGECRCPHCGASRQHKTASDWDTDPQACVDCVRSLRDVTVKSTEISETAAA